MGKKKKKLSTRVWFTAVLAAAVVICSMVYVYFYYKVPVYKYPKAASSYKIDRKILMTPDGALAAFLKSVYEGDADLCRSVVSSRVFELYGNHYYYGVFNDDKIRYLLSETNKKYCEEYGDDWFDNMVIESVDKKKDERDLTTIGTVKAAVGDKSFDWDEAIIGFDDSYNMKSSLMDDMFEPLLEDPDKRPPEY